MTQSDTSSTAPNDGTDALTGAGPSSQAQPNIGATPLTDTQLATLKAQHGGSATSSVVPASTTGKPGYTLITFQDGTALQVTAAPGPVTTNQDGTTTTGPRVAFLRGPGGRTSPRRTPW